MAIILISVLYRQPSMYDFYTKFIPTKISIVGCEPVRMTEATKLFAIIYLLISVENCAQSFDVTLDEPLNKLFVFYFDSKSQF